MIICIQVPYMDFCCCYFRYFLTNTESSQSEMLEVIVKYRDTDHMFHTFISPTVL